MTHFNIRTNAQRMTSANAAMALDLKSDIKMLSEITRNIEESIETKDAGPLVYLLDYLAGSGQKLKAATAIIRAVSFGLSVKLDTNTGRHVASIKENAGVNRHFETLAGFVNGGNTGLMGNTLHDAIKSSWTPPKPKSEFDADKTVSRAIDAMRKAGMDDHAIMAALRKAMGEIVKAGNGNVPDTKPLFDTIQNNERDAKPGSLVAKLRAA